jgi:hypothetical protein
MERVAGWLVVAVAAVIALVGARPYAGCWNDGSRLATVEALVDRHTLVIDHSIFVEVPAAAPYPPSEAALRETGTLDKVLVNGHYYSDKSPVPALLLAALYQVLQWTTGLTARGRPDLFCLAMTWASAGLPYVVAVWSVFRLGHPLRLDLRLRLLLTASFALATVALPYARHVNNHVLLLGVTGPLMLGLARLAEAACSGGRVRVGALLGLGALAGLGYTIDLGAGPVLFVCTLAVVAYRGRVPGAVAWFLAAALPWLALHHAVNYAVGGTLAPANAVAAYLQWTGSPFTPETITGGWKHPSMAHLLLYAAELLLGKQGFLGHNLPLYLAVPALAVLCGRRAPELPEVLFAGCFCGGTWLLYAVNSVNHSGLCCSVRWFVPLLAPAYYALAVVLRDRPGWRGPFLALSGWGVVLGVLMWVEGPWRKHMVPGFWALQAAAWLSCLLLQVRRRPRRHAAPARPGATARAA